ncbi:MAG: hydrogenase maturation nickel metallochaperone HypA [Thermoplasmata archaeon]
MHEFSVMSEIMEALIEESRKNGVLGVRKVVLEVGELTFLGHEQLRFAYEVLSDGTVFDGSELVLETRRARLKCDSCGYESQANSQERPEFHLYLPSFRCPECGQPMDVTSGNECIIRKMVVDVED